MNISVNEKTWNEFLLKRETEIYELITGNEPVMRCFREQLRDYEKRCETWNQEVLKYKNIATSIRRWRTREAGPPFKGYVWDYNYRFWRPSEEWPPNPDSWLQLSTHPLIHNIGLCDEPTRPPDDDEKLMCAYVIAVKLYDAIATGTIDERINFDTDDIPVDIANGSHEALVQINRACRRVRTDLISKGLITKENSFARDLTKTETSEKTEQEPAKTKPETEPTLPGKSKASPLPVSPEAKVLGVYADNPGLNKTKIAEKAGVPRQSLYRMPKFLAVWKMRKAEEATSYKDAKPAGEKDGKTGKLEAWKK